MESLLTSYGINFQDFCDTFRRMNYLVAGSSALAEYLKQEGVDPGFTPNDIDIFLRGRYEYPRNRRFGSNQGKWSESALTIIKTFLAKYGFHEPDGYQEPEQQAYYQSVRNIKRVKSFKNADNKVIQIIVIKLIPYRCLEQYICEKFDLSICATWYDMETNTFKTLNPGYTKRKACYYLLGPEEITEKYRMREQKYVRRGFEMVEPGSYWPCMVSSDTRTDITHSTFDNITVTDIFSLEDLSIREHLTKSSCNIVFKSGTQWYGFDRKQLLNYLESKLSHIPHIGSIFQTPFNQCINEEMILQFGYSDFSIYELIHAYSVPNGRQVWSLCHMDCYSVKNWVDNVKGKEIRIPPEPVPIPDDEVPELVIVGRGHPLAPQDPELSRIMDALDEERAVENAVAEAEVEPGLPVVPLEDPLRSAEQQRNEEQRRVLIELLPIAMNGISEIHHMIHANGSRHIDIGMFRRFEMNIRNAYEDLYHIMQQLVPGFSIPRR